MTTVMNSGFQVSADLEELRQAARTYAQERIKPVALEMDLAPHDDFNWDLVREGAQLGLLRMIIPKEYGGVGGGVVGTAIVMEEIAAACAGTALIFGATMLGQSPILLSGDQELQSRYLPMFASDEPVLACNAITEIQNGCDLLVPENAKYATDFMRAERDGDHYILNGSKKFITNGANAKIGSVYASLPGYEGADGLSCFIVEMDWPGIEVVGIADKVGYRACLGTELKFTNVRVPKENLVGGEGNGMWINVAQMDMARSITAAISTGVARGAFELAKQWAGERVQGGKLLKDQQFTMRKLAEMATKIDASRLLYMRSAQVADTTLPAPSLEPAMAKLFADQMAIEVTTEAMGVMNARGYIREYGMEKYMRDALGARIYEGTPEVLSMVITENLYKEVDEDDQW